VGWALTPTLVRKINEEWPAKNDPRWYVEQAGYVRKSALMFPARLPPTAQAVARALYSEEARALLAGMLGFEVLADPWFEDGPELPRVGGGLHEIGTGGLLGMHLDFDAHPTGLTRAVNLLIYLNEEWRNEWGGALELGESKDKSRKMIVPNAGVTVVFETDGGSWHGHPVPLTCPVDRARRSLALYYYRNPVKQQERRTTKYARA
jgi:hypothetical protein